MKKKVLLFLFLIYALVSCVTFPNGVCAVESMILTKEDLPEGSIVGPLESHIAEWPYISAGVDASYHDSSILHIVGRYPTTDSAKKEFEIYKQSSSRQTSTNGPWERPTGLSFKTRIFENYYVACSERQILGYQCRMMGQYQEYYVFFFAYITDTGITLDSMNQLLEKIDARMEKCLKE